MKTLAKTPGTVAKWIPNLITLASLGVGFAAVISAAQSNIPLAVFLTWLSALLDSIDGRVARSLNASSALGLQLDSLADLIAFGAAPAAIAYFAFLNQFGVAGIIISAAFPIACAFRLARFNVLNSSIEKPNYFTGCPAPVAALGLTSITLIAKNHFNSPGLIAISLLAIAFLMASKIPYTKKIPWKKSIVATSAIILTIILREYFVAAAFMLYSIFGAKKE